MKAPDTIRFDSAANDTLYEPSTPIDRQRLADGAALRLTIVLTDSLHAWQLIYIRQVYLHIFQMLSDKRIKVHFSSFQSAMYKNF